MSIKNAGIGPILKMPVEAQATDALRRSIVSGNLAPGSRVTEVNLANQMNLSRATVRTALHQLNKEGLVRLVPYTGWLVVELSSQDAWELYTLRSAVERLAGRLVAGRLSEPDSEPIKKELNSAFLALQKACHAGEQDEIAEADFEFHKKIIELAKHKRLQHQYELIEQQVRMYIRSSDALIDNAEQIISQHQPILGALLSGDIENAGELSEIHNLVEGEKLSRHLRSLEGETATVRSGA